MAVEGLDQGALLLRGGDLVADPFAGDLALELGKGQQHIEGQPPHRARRIEVLGDRDERGALCIEDLDQPSKIGQRAGQPVNLVDDDDIDPASPDVGKQALECRPLDVAAREPAIIIAGPGQYPALVTLAGDVGLARFADHASDLRREGRALAGRVAATYVPDVERVRQLICGEPSARPSGLAPLSVHNGDKKGDLAISPYQPLSPRELLRVFRI